MPTVPIVPTEELQGGSFQPFSVGVEVAPMRDVAGRQAQEMGQSMVNAGQVLGSIANKMQDQMDDAATKQADVTFLTKAQDILWGEKGYLNTLGAGAADPSSVNAALIEAKKEVEKGLTNDVQRMMFGQSASRNMLNFSGKIAEHRFKQTTDYAAGESKSRADRYTMEAANNFDSIGMVDAKGNPTGPYNTAVNTALQEANAAADLMMLPPDSEQRLAMVRGVYGNVASGVVNNRQYYFTSRGFATKNVDVLKIAIEEINAIDTWIDKNKPAAAVELASVLGLDKSITELYVGRAAYGTAPVTRAILAEQQAIADTFFELKLIPKKLNLLHAAPVDLG